MREEQEDNVQFKMRLDEDVEEAVIANQVDDLRIEKLNHRMTLITILIPVLIVVILGVAYMDIKRRVVRTEDSGQLTAQSLSEDLQSRFSTLSVGQAMIEENFARLKDQTEQSIAKVQVNLKNLDDSLKTFSSRMASRSDMKTTADKMDKGLDNLGQSIEDMGDRLQTLDESMQQQLAAIEQSIAETAARLDDLDQSVTRIDEEKLDKPSLELALKLEILKLKQAINVTLDENKALVAANQSEIKALKQQVARLKAMKSAPAGTSSSSGTLQEQTIKK